MIWSILKEIEMNTAINDQAVYLNIMSAFYHSGSVSAVGVYEGKTTTFTMSLDIDNNMFTLSKDMVMQFAARMSDVEVIEFLLIMANKMEEEEGNTIRISDFH
jgi:hypothetical protein